MRGYFFIHDALTLTGEGNPYESAYNLNWKIGKFGPWGPNLLWHRDETVTWQRARRYKLRILLSTIQGVLKVRYHVQYPEKKFDDLVRK